MQPYQFADKIKFSDSQENSLKKELKVIFKALFSTLRFLFFFFSFNARWSSTNSVVPAQALILRWILTQLKVPCGIFWLNGKPSGATTELSRLVEGKGTNGFLQCTNTKLAFHGVAWGTNARN